MSKTNTVEKPVAKNAIVKLRIDEDKRDRLKAIASHEKRTLSAIVEQAIDDRIEYEEDWVRGVEKAIAQADHGETISNDEIGKWVQSLGTKNPLPRPAVRK